MSKATYRRFCARIDEPRKELLDSKEDTAGVDRAGQPVAGARILPIAKRASTIPGDTPLDASLGGTIAADSATTTAPVTASPMFSWPHACKLSLNTTRTGSAIAVPLTRFPVAVALDAATFDFATVNGTGGNIRFARLVGTPMSHEVESWDSAGRQAALWVRFDPVFADSVQPFWMYWGKDGEPDLSDPEAVFDTAAGFHAVWHLSEGTAGTGATDLYKDAAARRSHGDGQVSDTGKSGVMGRGQRFDGADDYIEVRPAVQIPTGPLTVSAWIKLRVNPDTSSNQGYCIVGTHSSPTMASSVRAVGFYPNETRGDS